ncbi:MAG: hypothetical protein SO160_02185 [Lachnospiraceae bacterium]|nr:hypothetical protein [Lachnospiraceae bacterium]
MDESKHIRTISQVVNYFKELDKNTAVTYGAIRYAVDRGYISSTKVGKRFLIVQEEVFDYFNGKTNNLQKSKDKE